MVARADGQSLWERLGEEGDEANRPWKRRAEGVASDALANGRDPCPWCGKKEWKSATLLQELASRKYEKRERDRKVSLSSIAAPVDVEVTVQGTHSQAGLSYWRLSALHTFRASAN